MAVSITLKAGQPQVWVTEKNLLIGGNNILVNFQNNKPRNGLISVCVYTRLNYGIYTPRAQFSPTLQLNIQREPHLRLYDTEDKKLMSSERSGFPSNHFNYQN